MKLLRSIEEHEKRSSVTAPRYFTSTDSAEHSAAQVSRNITKITIRGMRSILRTLPKRCFLIFDDHIRHREAGKRAGDCQTEIDAGRADGIAVRVVRAADDGKTARNIHSVRRSQARLRINSQRNRIVGPALR